MYKILLGLARRVPQLDGRIGHALYPYAFDPGQLMRLAGLAREASDETEGRGSFVEAGCAAGATTVFLNRLMRGFPHQHPYIALDTFAGFTRVDVAHEVDVRGKPRGLRDEFVVNDQAWFDRDLRANGITTVRSIRCDVGAFEFASLGPIAFCLLDVDLYRPTKAALARILDQLLPGGILVVDDCAVGNRYDGAELAYREFCEERHRPYDVRGGRFGIIAGTEIAAS